ncbi:unnamed protein product [Musa acuminata subsp. malaccensis]|uniref:(wild Malaysian banana) hypothetical protein n=1 Tax=Musa acuminata subsp. malaccensis TaxID=214687 RepID=A0A8D6ZSM7_MUSAM|nr:unnamed protein product [Musa acuminata subsp. malaccensis]
MAKNRNNKTKNKSNPKKDGAVPIHASTEAVGDVPQLMDTSDGNPSNPVLGAINRKIKKAIPVKRSKNIRKLKLIAKAIANSEKGEEKQSRNKSKMLRIHSAKSLYD